MTEDGWKKTEGRGLEDKKIRKAEEQTVKLGIAHRAKSIAWRTNERRWEG